MLVASVITRNFLPCARVLAASVLRSNPGARILIVVVDQSSDASSGAPEPFEILTPRDLSCTEVLRQMSFYYTPFEFCCAVRPFLHQYLLEQSSEVKWVVLDSDIVVYGNLSPVFSALDNWPILLTPHQRVPLPTGVDARSERTFLWAGAFNGGFLGLRRSREAERFIAWFRERLEKHCWQAENGTFGDQAWLNLVPVFFRQFGIFDHPGANLGHWNLHEAALRRSGDGTPLANGEPLLFVHFSGWRIDRPREVSEFRPDWLGRAPLVWSELGEDYRAALIEAGYEREFHVPTPLAYYDDGTPIGLRERRQYFRLLEEGRAPANPFASGRLLRESAGLESG